MAFNDLRYSWRKKSEPPANGPPRPVILVIDDDAAARDSLDFILSEKYDVLLCASAREGLAALRDGVYAVVLDVKMEGHDGFWACDQLRKRQPDIPIIFYSAYQNIKDPARVIREHRPFAYVIKDGDINRILTSIETAVRVYTLTMENKRFNDSLKGTRRDD
ncbi:response regulator [Sorangium sp. So ce281]|uniref:response regulator n=1 Tax=unclassified Sorangium TaxID=2621164 RepID=UPI003F6018D5